MGEWFGSSVSFIQQGFEACLLAKLLCFNILVFLILRSEPKAVRRVTMNVPEPPIALRSQERPDPPGTLPRDEIQVSGHQQHATSSGESQITTMQDHADRNTVCK